MLGKGAGGRQEVGVRRDGAKTGPRRSRYRRRERRLRRTAPCTRLGRYRRQNASIAFVSLSAATRLGRRRTFPPRSAWRIRVQPLRWRITISFARHQFPPAIIRHAVWLYVRFSLSYRGVEDLLAERGLDISYETVRRWVLKFGRRCHTNLDRRGAGFGRPAELQAAVTARHARKRFVS